MAHTKPIVAAVSGGIGVALVLLAVHLQRDRLAFTAEPPARELLVHMTFAPPLAPFGGTQPAPDVSETAAIVIEPLEVLPTQPRRQPPRRVAPETERMQPAETPCNPAWRELESGPVGRRVREICPPAPANDIPRS